MAASVLMIAASVAPMRCWTRKLRVADLPQRHAGAQGRQQPSFGVGQAQHHLAGRDLAVGLAVDDAGLGGVDQAARELGLLGAGRTGGVEV
jgi:hypothetical protein